MEIRTTSSRLLVNGIAMLFAACFLMLAIAAPVYADTARVAKVEKVTGTVNVKKAGGTKAYKAFAGMSLNKGDQISTGPASSVILSIVDHEDEITMGENTEIYLSQLQEAVGGKQTGIQVASGSAYVKVKSLTNQTDQFHVETPTAIMGVRGTQFLFTFDPTTGRSGVVVASGVVEVHPSGGAIAPVQPLMQGTFFGRQGELPPESSVSAILPEDFLKHASSDTIEAILRNKETMDQENEDMIAKLKQEFANNRETGSSPPGLEETEDIERYARNIESFLSSLLREAMNDGKLSPQQVEEIVRRAESDPSAGLIDLDRSVNWPEPVLNERLNEQRRIEEMRRQREEEVQRKREQQRNQAESQRNDIMQRVEEQRKKLEQENREAAQRAQERARQALLERTGSDPNSIEGARGPASGGSGGSGSGGSGSGGSGGRQDEKEDRTRVVEVDDLSVTIEVDSAYTLPRLIPAKLNDGSTGQTPVSWIPSQIDTSQTGRFQAVGRVAGYDQTVLLTVQIYRPLGKPVKVKQGPMEFANGFVLDVGTNAVPAEATVTVRETQPASPGTGLTPAGLVLDFAFSGIELTSPVTLSYPLQGGRNSDDVGVFYKKSDSEWEHVKDTVIQNGRAIARVGHFSTYGVYHAAQAPVVNADPAGGLVNPNTAVHLNAPGAETVYYSQGGRFNRYNPANPPVIADGREIEAYAVAANMRDSETTKWTYTTASASVEDSQTILLSFTSPIRSGSGSGVVLENGRSYRFSIVSDNDSQQLAIANGSQVGSTSLRLTLQTDTALMPQNSFVVMFVDESGNLAAQTNSFLLGIIPPPEPEPQPEPQPDPKVELQVSVDGPSVFVEWSAVRGAVYYEICLFGGGQERCTTVMAEEELSALFSEVSNPGEYHAVVNAVDRNGNILASGGKTFEVRSPNLFYPDVMVDGNSVSINWEAVPGAVEYEVCLYGDGQSGCDWIQDDGPMIWHYVYSLTPGEEYSFDIYAYDENEMVIASGQGAFSIDALEEIPIMIADVTANAISIVWMYDASFSGEFRLLLNREEVGYVDSDRTKEFTFGDLEPNTQYVIAVSAWPVGADYPIALGQLTQATAGSPTVESMEVGVSEIAADQALIEWELVTGAVKYIIDLDDETVATIPGDGQRTHRLASLLPDTAYEVVVRAYDSNDKLIAQGESAFRTMTEQVNLTLAVEEVGETTISISWSYSDPSVGTYRVSLNGTEVANVPGGDTQYTFTDLQPDTEYEVQVQAMPVEAGSPLASDQKTVKTAPPSA